MLENLSLADNKGRPYGLGRGVNKKRIGFYRDQLAALGLGLEDKLDVRMGSLSGGQRQAVALLMATMTPLKFLILDEHTAALDPKTAETIMVLTDKLVREKGLTAMMVTHNLRYAVEYGDRILMMNRGPCGAGPGGGGEGRHLHGRHPGHVQQESPWRRGTDGPDTEGGGALFRSARRLGIVPESRAHALLPGLIRQTAQGPVYGEVHSEDAGHAADELGDGLRHEHAGGVQPDGQEHRQRGVDDGLAQHGEENGLPGPPQLTNTPCPAMWRDMNTNMLK